MRINFRNEVVRNENTKTFKVSKRLKKQLGFDDES